MVNRLNTTVAVGQGTAHLENLVDRDLTNGTTFISGVSVKTITEPSYTIRDVSRTYAKGTTAGFVVTIDNAVLKVTAVETPMIIFFYKDGNKVGSVACEQKEGSALKLQLASYSKNTVEYTAKAPADFDEIGLGFSEGLKADVASYMTVKYAFVGKNGKYFIDSEQKNGIKDFEAAVKAAYPGTTFNDDKLVLGQCITDLQKTPNNTGNTIDNNPDNNVDIITKLLLTVWTPVTVSAYGGASTNNMPFKKGMTVGFETAGAGILDVGSSIKLHPYIMTPSQKSGLFESTWTWTEAPKGGNEGEFTLLGVDLGGGRKDIITTLTQDCNAVELKAESFLGLGATVAYRMFVVLPPEMDDDDTLSVSAPQSICEDVKEVKLYSNRPVTWTCTTDNNIVPTADDATRKIYTVSGLTKAGTYTFKATDDTTKATRTTMVTYGIQRLYDTTTEPWVNNFTEPDVIYHVMTVDEMTKEGINGFSLLDASSSKSAKNLINGSIDDYMSYNNGIQLAGSNVIAAVKRSKPLHLKNNTRVGFVLMMNGQLLNVDLLSSMKVYAYNSGKRCTEISRDHNFKVLQANVAGGSNMQTTEFNIVLKDDQDVDELMLCNNKALNIDLSNIRIYYAFSEDENDAKAFETEQQKQGEIVNYKNGARIDEKMMGGYQNLVAIASLKNNYTNFINGNLTDYLSITNTVEAASGANIIPVKLGKIYSGKHLVQVYMGKVTGLADVDLGDVFQMDAYLHGQKVATKTTWNAVDANVIKAGGDYTLRWTPNKDFDEIVIREKAVAKLLNTEEKFYGMSIFSDADGDGTPDYDDDESCPDVAFLIDENEPCLDKTHDFTCSKMYLHRSFNKGKWSTICLPVDMTYNQFAATFGSEARLAAPTDFGTNTPNYVQFNIEETHGNQILLHKNRPYAIKVDSLANVTINSKIVADNSEQGTLAEEKQQNMSYADGITTPGAIYLVHGISYDTAENNTTNIPERSFEHSRSQFWDMNQITWHGTFVYPQKIDESFYSFLMTPNNGKDAEFVYVKDGVAHFRGLRCWMTTDSQAGAKQFPIAIGNNIITNGTTGISSVISQKQTDSNIYSLSGTLIKRDATNTEGLAKGIYIWNNKKIEIK